MEHLLLLLWCLIAGVRLAIGMADEDEALAPLPTAKFPLGQVVATRGVAARMEETPAFRTFVACCLARHHEGDWGTMCPEDQELNEQALKDGDRLMSSYGDEPDKIWIITEADRSVTTALFPDEY